MKNNLKCLSLKSISLFLAAVCCMGTAGLYAGSPVHAEMTLAELEQKREENNKKIAEYEAQLSEYSESQKAEEEYQAALQVKIDAIQENMGIMDAQLESIKERLFNLDLDISEMEDTIDRQEEDIDEGLEQFKLRLRAMYINGNDSLASALVGSTDFYDLLSKFELISCVARHDDELVNGLRDELESYNANLLTLEAQKAEQERSQAEAEAKKAEMKDSVEELNAAIAESEAEKQRLEAEKSRADKSIEDLKAENAQWDKAEQEILDAIARAEEEARRKAEEERRKAEEERRQKEEAANQNQGGNNTAQPDPEPSRPSYSESSFVWPCPSCYYVSSTYGYRWGRLHKGIDIAAGGGSAIVASRSGTVISCNTSCVHNYGKEYNCCGNGYGNYVVISHDGTYTTLYGHMQSVYVSVGDYVNQGQTIGEVGTTGHSTGYHLHFEVRENGSPVNPSGYVNY